MVAVVGNAALHGRIDRPNYFVVVNLTINLARSVMGKFCASRKNAVIAIVIAVAGLHFVVGPSYDGPWQVFVASYLIDITLPFAMVLLLGITNITAFRSPLVRALLVFGFGAVVETLQYLGVPIFGSVPDPVDYAMYAIGVAAAVVFEQAVLCRLPVKTSD